MRSKLLLLISLIALSVLSACAPRGESKSLSEVYEGAKDRYMTAREAKSTSVDLSAIEESLASWVSDVSYDGARKISSELRGLILKAGYTSRPAMGEIIEQYQTIEFDQSSMKLQPARVKLLVARTYNVLARELETTGFRVQG